MRAPACWVFPDSDRATCPTLSGSAVLRGMDQAAPSPSIEPSTQAAINGDSEAWGALIEQVRGRLKRMISLRMDRRLQGRVDPSDVVQEALLEATRRRGEYAADPSVGFYIWVRFIASQQLQIHRRRHLGAQARDAGREVSIFDAPASNATSEALAAHLLGHDTRVSEAVLRAERALQLQLALDRLDPVDREALALRHFEQLTHSECARVLGISEAAAAKRYVRALMRLKDALPPATGSLPGSRS